MSRGAARPEVLVFIVDAGGGHRSAANALVAAAAEVGSPLKFRVVSLQKVLDALDIWRSITGVSIEATYNALLRGTLTRLVAPMMRVLHFTIRLRFSALKRRVESYLRGGDPPSLVLSLAPNFNAVLRDAVASALPGVPFLVLLTDYADTPPHFWIEPGLERVIVGSEAAAGQAREAGIPEDRISKTSGMLLHPRFYAPRPSRPAARAALGIAPDAFVALVLFGGKGSHELVSLCDALLAHSSGFHVVAICGDNPPLLARMEVLARGSSGRLRAVGFTDRVFEFMGASDVLLTKPGPGSLAEAFHMGLPVILPLNESTMPQERFNARMVQESGLGLVVEGVGDMPEAAARIRLEGDLLGRLRENAHRLIENRAVYEVLELLQREASGRAGEGPASGPEAARPPVESYS